MSMKFRAAMIAVLLPASACAQSGADRSDANRPDQVPAFIGQTRAPVIASGVRYAVTTVATGIDNGYGLAFLPDGRALVTEKPGRLRLVGRDGVLSEPIAGTPRVVHKEQGGLLGLAVVPGGLCLSFSEPRGGGRSGTTVNCYKLRVDGAAVSLGAPVTVWRQEPAYGPSAKHFGGRIVLAGDGTLFVTNGERSDTPIRDTAQSLANGLGKIARVSVDGSVPAGNPFASSPDPLTRKLWSFGHRNVQAAALDPAGRLWTVEHGPKGGDELNRPQAGRNHGWPVITYGEDYNGRPINGDITAKPGMEQPVYFWDPVIGPSGMAFYSGAMFPRWRGSVFIGGLVAGGLVRLELSGDRVTGEERIELGERVRDVVQAPDGSLWVLTDGDGGRILRVAAK